MGYQTAKLLYQQLEDLQVKQFTKVFVAPIGLNERQSSNFSPLNDPLAIQTLHYIRQHTIQGVRLQPIDIFGLFHSSMVSQCEAEKGHSIHHELHHLKTSAGMSLTTLNQLPRHPIATDCGYPS